MITGIRGLILAVSILALSACGGGSNSGQPGNNLRGKLVSVTAKSSYSQLDLVAIALLGKFVPNNQASIAYDVEVHKLVYWTIDTNGAPVKASGLVAVPKKAPGTTTALLSIQHGTIFHNNDAPTNYAAYDVLSALFSSMNFIVTMPDYLGYGESAALLHPYLHAESMSTATIDLLRATRQWLNSNNIGINNQLFLGGYSEGGYATLATHKLLQVQYADEFTVTASAPGGGPYDLLGTANYYLNSVTLPYAPYVSFIFKAYDDVYGYNRISDIFQAPYVDPVNNYFYGTYTSSQIDAALTNVTADLFNTVFLDDFRGTGEAGIKADLIANNIYDWKPVSPVRFYHGQDDTDVPYENATTAVSAMTSNGESNISLVNCTAVPATHNGCIDLYLDDMVGYFLSF